MKQKLLIIFFLALTSLALAQGQRVTIYNEWKSNHCNYRPERPFSIIISPYEFHYFWKNSGIDEVEPALDFDKYMVFLWIPGTTLYDVLESQMDEVRYQPESCVILFNFKRKMTGKWLKPVIATVLPKIENVDFFIYKRVEMGHLKPPKWEHYSSLWDMNKLRSRDLVVAKVDPEEKLTDNFIIEKNTQAYQDIFEEIHSPTESSIETAFGADHGISPQPTVSEPDPFSIFTPAQQQPKTEERPKPQVAPKVPTTTFQPRLPALMDEDPLFGSEFDITF
jgi:hypothetical protein